MAKRRIKFSEWGRVNGEYKQIEGFEGLFHGWGVDYEELDEGPGSFTVAIVEMPDGTIKLPQARNVQFLDEAKPEILIVSDAVCGDPDAIKELRNQLENYHQKPSKEPIKPICEACGKPPPWPRCRTPKCAGLKTPNRQD